MSIKESLEFLKRKNKLVKEQEEKDKKELHELTHVKLKNLLDKIVLDLNSIAFKADLSLSDDKYSKDTWVLSVSKGNKNKTIEIYPMWGDKKSGKLGDDFGVSCDHVCTIYSQSDLLRSIEDIIAKAIIKLD